MRAILTAKLKTSLSIKSTEVRQGTRNISNGSRKRKTRRVSPPPPRKAK